VAAQNFLLSVSSGGVFLKVATQVKKHTFMGALDFQIAMAGKLG